MTIEFSEGVFTNAVAGNVSIVSGAKDFPCVTPCSMRRAAVRWAMPMPSPTMMMRLRALMPVSVVRLTTSRLPVAVAMAPSPWTARTVRVRTPGVVRLVARSVAVKLPFAPPSVMAATVTVPATTLPSIRNWALVMVCPGSGRIVAWRSKRWPGRKREMNGGVGSP